MMPKLNASIHHALPSITRRAVRDFGRKMVAESKEELILHFSTSDLDDIADNIINKASDSFLDKCLEKRLLTIDAKLLVDALARAERLGYDQSDIVQDNQAERVVPQEAYPGAASAANGFAQAQAAQPAPPPPTQQPAGYQPTPQLQCLRCYRTFTYQTAHDYVSSPNPYTTCRPSNESQHMKHNVCSLRPPGNEGFKHACAHCGEGFTAMDHLQMVSRCGLAVSRHRARD